MLYDNFMNPTNESRASRLEELEDQYGYLQDELTSGKSMCSPWRRRQALREHANRPKPIQPTLKPTIPSTGHLHKILSDDVMHAEKGIRPSHIVVAERSYDQILDTLHNMGDVAVMLARAR